jgi:prephenate dehydrogenase
MTVWNKVAIVGVGLIGGSIGLALRKRKLAGTVIGIGRPQSQSSLKEAFDLGAIDSATTNLDDGVAEADFIVICTPINEILTHLLQAAKAAPNHAILTDAGSTKASVVANVEAAIPAGKHFVGSHPLAGSEKKGVRFARAELFESRVTIVTPSDRTSKNDIQAVSNFWSSLGSNVVAMSPATHDRVLAGTSHLPHLVAAALAGVTPTSDLPLTAGGWRDVTRIAAGDPDLWTQILLENHANVLKSLAGFEKTVAEFRSAIERGDSAQLRALLTEGKKVRDALGD